MQFTLHTKGHGEFIDITDRAEQAVRDAKVTDGIAVLFAKHTTTSIIVADDEEGLKQDFRDALERLFSEDAQYRHNSPGDTNAHGHLRSMVCGCSVTVPITNGKLDLGSWQRIFFVDFDSKSRERTVKVMVLGNPEMH